MTIICYIISLYSLQTVFLDHVVTILSFLSFEGSSLIVSLLKSLLPQLHLSCSVFIFECFTVLSAFVLLMCVLHCTISFALLLSVYRLNMFSCTFCS